MGDDARETRGTPRTARAESYAAAEAARGGGEAARGGGEAYVQGAGDAATAAAAGRSAAHLESLATRLHSVAIHLLRRVRVEDEAIGVSPARASALSVLVFGGERTVGELAAAEQVSAPTMSRIVAALEAEGLVERRRGEEDRRSVVVRATARGRALLAEGRRRRVEHLRALLSGLAAEEVAALSRAAVLLEKVLRDGGRKA